MSAHIAAAGTGKRTGLRGGRAFSYLTRPPHCRPEDPSLLYSSRFNSLFFVSDMAACAHRTRPIHSLPHLSISLCRSIDKSILSFVFFSLTLKGHGRASRFKRCPAGFTYFWTTPYPNQADSYLFKCAWWRIGFATVRPPAKRMCKQEHISTGDFMCQILCSSSRYLRHNCTPNTSAVTAGVVAVPAFNADGARGRTEDGQAQILALPVERR